MSGPVQGLIVDELGHALPDIDVLIQSRGSMAVNRQLKTDIDGRFLAHGIPDGQYLVAFAGKGLDGREYDLTVAGTLKAADWRVTLERVAWPTPAPPAVVTAADVPGYPADAWDAGVSGTVDVRISFAEAARQRNVHYVSDIDVVGGDERLKRAVRQNLATWRFVSVTVPVLTIRYSFELIAGDCAGPQIPTVHLKFPSSVVLVAKRRVPCLLPDAPVIKH